MQTKLRIVKPFAVSLLLTFLISPATQNATATPKHAPGIASWYGKERQGQPMANGRKFNRFALTAASWSLPLGTKIRVVNAANGKSVVVTITDRGPARRLHRILDLSEAAAHQLGYIDLGLAQVSYAPLAIARPVSVRPILN